MALSEVTAFLENGFVLKALFSKAEVDALNTVVNNDPTIQEATYGRMMPVEQPQN